MNGGSDCACLFDAKEIEALRFSEPEPVPNLTEYDWIVISSSGGKDSQAITDEVCARAEAAGVLDRVVIVHCDLGRVEWRGTREIVEAQAARYGVPCLVVWRRNGDLLEQVEERGMWPSPQQRYCTSDQKRAQVHRVYTALSTGTRATMPRPKRGEARRVVRILSCQGMRAQESPNRAKLPQLAIDQRASNGRREVTNWLPIHRWTEQMVWERLRSCRSADLIHYAYALGMKRVSCCFCIFADRASLVLAARQNPELATEYVRIEKKINHRFRLDLSMAEVREIALSGENVGAPTDFTM